MEFTVSKADLVRELNLSQGVVEKKTTIPILSNVLVEARGSDSSDRHRSGTGHSVFLSGAGEEGRARVRFRRDACWIMCACCPMPTSKSRSRRTTGPA